MNNTRWLPILIVLIAGVVLGGLILGWDRIAAPRGADTVPQPQPMAAAGNDAGASRPGPHGGRLLTQDGFSVEVTIFELGVPPRFRLYLYEGGQPLPPNNARIALTLSRLGAPLQVFRFTPEADYLLGDQVVDEPHSFKVAITAELGGKELRWSYDQVESRVEMADETLKSSGIEILTAGPGTIRPALKLPGEVAFNGRQLVHVVPRVAGVVTAVNRELGQQVQKGEVLAVIESNVLADLRSQFLAAQKRLAMAQAAFEREKQLWEEKISAKQDYLAAQNALGEAEIAADLAGARLQAFGVPAETAWQRKHLTRYEIRAPLAGLIVAKAIAPGQTLKEDADIFTVADMSTVWAQVTVYPKDLGVIRPGQKALIRATAFDAVGEGTVSYVGTLVGEQTRTAQARITLDNRDGRWRPGMFLEVELMTEDVKVPVAVAAAAIQAWHDRPVVFGRYGQYFEARPLVLGRSDGRRVEVLKGLSAGERYASGNSFAIKAELGKSSASHDH